MLRRLAALAAALVGVAPVSGAGAGLRAEPITEANVGELQIGGPDAIGGVGDWYLANDLVEFVIDDPSRRHAKQNHGGSLVDAGIVGVEGEDQFARIFTILNNSQRVGPAYDSLRAEVDPDGAFARIRVWGSQGIDTLPRGGWLSRRFDVLVPEPDAVRQVFAETEYEVRPGEPFVRITSLLRNEGSSAAPVSSWGDVWMRGGRGMRPFVGNTLTPDASRGFHHQSFDPKHVLEAGDAIAAWTFAAAAGVPGFPPVAYAIFSPDRAARGLVNFGVTGKHVTLASGFVGDPAWEALTPWRLMRSVFLELGAGETWTFTRRLMVTRGPDVASTTDRIFPMMGFADGSSGIRGRVEPAGERAAIHVASAAGAPVTQCLTVDGSYSAILPPGDYVLTLRAAHREPREVEVAVPDGAFREVPVQRLEPTGVLVFDPAFADAGPGRVVVRGVDGTPDPVFQPELLDFRIDGRATDSATETRELQFIGNASDPKRVAIAPGRYRLLATRGFDHSLAEVTLDVPAPGAEVRVEPFAPVRAIELRGIVSADMHVHAEASDDSGMSNEARLRSMLAAGIQVMVSTDHDHVGRFEPALDALDLRGRIALVTGVEVTSSTPSPATPWTLGHHNAWPIAHVAAAHRQGAPPSQDLPLAELYALLRRDYGASILQLNHPLGEGHEVEPGEFLSHMGSVGERFDPSRPLEAAPNRALLETALDGRTRAIDFDAIEVMNGASFDRYLATREVWYSLLRQGVLRTATGNSDTHGPAEIAGIPRNFVYLDGAPDDTTFDATTFDRARFDAAVRNARSFISTGPLVAAFLANGGRTGDVVEAEGGEVEVTLAVAAASWVPIDEVRLLIDGEVARTFRELADADEILRLATTLSLSLQRDAFLTLEAGTALDVDSARWIEERAGVYADVAPGFVPQLLSNPIFVDVDGNSRFDAPGLGSAADSDATLWQLVLIGGVIALMAIVWLRLRSRALTPHST